MHPLELRIRQSKFTKLWDFSRMTNQSKHGFFAMQRRKHRDPKTASPTDTVIDKERTILGLSTFGQIQIRHDFDSCQ